MAQLELFAEPEPIIEDLTFFLKLKDGTFLKVDFERNKDYLHFDFYGIGISSTGYRSHYFFWDKDGDLINATSDGIMKIAEQEAEGLRKEYLAEQAKKNKKAGVKA